MMLAGRPRDGKAWAEVCAEAVRAMNEEGRQYAGGSDPDEPHRRGDYPNGSGGFSFGGGQKVSLSIPLCGAADVLYCLQKPSNMAHDSAYKAKLIDQLRENSALLRIAGFIDGEYAMRVTLLRLTLHTGCFLQYAPRLYAHYEKVTNELMDKDKSLRKMFDNCVFAAATLNIGPKVRTYIHTDHLNFAAGWCAVIALGDFDPEQGGHLVLWDLGLVIEFPPGSLIFLPSAVLRHSNLPIGENESRYSFTQYTAGGLFRWAECGFQSLKSLREKGGALNTTGWERWEEGISRFCHVDELMSRV